VACGLISDAEECGPILKIAHELLYDIRKLTQTQSTWVHLQFLVDFPFALDDDFFNLRKHSGVWAHCLLAQ